MPRCSSRRRTRRSPPGPSRGWRARPASRPGVLNVVHGLGEEAGAPLVESPRGGSSSASPAPPRWAAGSRRPRARGWPRSASSWAARIRSSSATTPISTAPPRRPSSPRSATPASAAPPEAGSSCSTPCTTRSASGCCARIAKLRVGCGDDDDFGPVINERQLYGDAAPRSSAARRRRRRPCSPAARRLTGPAYDGGYFMAPTLLENADPDDRRSRRTELFGPISVPLPGAGLRGRAWPRQRLALRAHRRHPHGERPPRDDLRRPGSAPAWRSSTAPPTAASRTCRSAGLGDRATAGARRAPRRSTCTRSWKTVYINYDPGAV